jgi:uncharacterized protein DUF4136
MKRSLLLTGFIALAALAPAFAVSVTQDYQPGTDFTKYKTFRLKAGTPADSPATQTQIEKAITSQLTSKGLTAGSENAELVIYTHVKIGVAKALDVSSFGYGGKSVPGGDNGTTSVNVVDVPTGTLMVDMVDSASQQMVWRGIAQGTIHPGSPTEKSEKRINDAVAKLLKNFPPAAKK